MKHEKLRKNSEFQQVYRRGRSFANNLLVLYVFKDRKNFLNSEPYNKLGISVSKKVGKSVVRSRVKRLISESYRLNKDHFVKGYDFAIIARVSSHDKSYEEMEKALKHVFKKAGMFNDEKNTTNNN
ncbi:MAG: ribonuclease P protein component [Clostridiaceae bacterium]